MTDEALDWMLRLRAESGNPATRAEFQRWLAGDPRRQQVVARLQRMQSLPSLRTATARDAVRLGMAPDAHMRQAEPARMRSRRWTMRITAAAAIVLVAIGIRQYPALMLRWQADYLTTTGELRRVRLPDGSEMRLNTASAVALQFRDGRRLVRLLAGEAYFDVQHDPQHPFIVAGPFSEVEAKGTAFDVRANDDRDVVVLERGRVEVRRQSDRADLTELRPDQMVAVSAKALSGTTVIDSDSSLAWRDGRIIFHDEPFNKALSELRRYYTGPVIVASSRFSTTMISGNYRVSDPLAAIQTLAESAGAVATHLPGGIIILR